MRSNACGRGLLALSLLPLPLAAQSAFTLRVTVDSSGVQANAYSDFAALARDGSCVAFRSAASNLVPGDTNGKSDVFVHELATGLTTRVSVATSGAQAHADGASTRLAISDGGRYVAFGSTSPDL